MAVTFEQRPRGPDRRHYPRGGRRTSDQPGRTPLVMVIDADAHSRNASDAILAKLHFAVAPMDSLDKALEVMAALRPDIIVTPASDAVRVRARLQADDENGAVPLVVVTDGVPEPEALVEDIRRALRAKRES